MPDNRIRACQEAAISMARGRFDVTIPGGQEDELARLGAALQILGTSLENRFRQHQRVMQVNEEINAGLLLDAIHGYLFLLAKGHFGVLTPPPIRDRKRGAVPGPRHAGAH